MKKSIEFLTWSYWAAISFIALLTLLHFIKPELAPSWNFISEYEVGRYGWLMQLAFLSLALSCIFLVLALWKPLNIAGKIGLLMLLLSAAGMLIAAIFKTDALNTAIELQTQAGKLHQLGAMLDQIPFATILITIALFRKKEWKLNKPLLIIAMLLVWFGFVYFVASVRIHFPADGKFGPNVPVGWQNRLMIVTQAVWLAIIVRQVRAAILFTK
jgi:hypothetical protein